MTSMYNFKGITVVPSASDLKEVVLSKTQRKTPTVVHRHYAISRIRSFYTRKIKFLQQTLHDKLSQIISEFPKTDEVHPFYADLMNILYDKDHYKIALGQINTARHLCAQIAREYVRQMKYADSLYRCKMLKRAALGRMVKLLKHQNSSFEYLEQVRQHLSRLPSIDPNTRTLILCGFPNVGKSSLMNKLTRADVEVQPYAFTTKSLYVGHFDYRYLRWQIIDTPGILDQPLEQRNTIEMQAVTALAHLKAAVVFMMDCSEQCNYTVEQQVQLFDSIRPLFANKPVYVGLNKIDILRRNQLSTEKEALLSKIEEDGIPIMELSTVSTEGIVSLRDNACDGLMAQRVQQKLRAKGTDNGIINRLFVAVPEPRDDVSRPAFVPKKGLKAAAGENNEQMDVDGQKIVYPEIWEGHNIADFIDSKMVEKFNQLQAEENANIEAGVYDTKMDDDDDETKRLLDLAGQIREREKMAVYEHRLKRTLDQPVRNRRLLHRERTKESFSEAMSKVGIDVSRKRMHNLEEDSSHPVRGKRMRVGTSTSLVPKTAPPRDVTGIADADAYQKIKKVKRKAQKPMQREARKGEGDRHVFDFMPKHLFCGKRGMGKTDRR